MATEKETANRLPLYIVTDPSALSELVVSKRQLDERHLSLSVNQHIDIVEVEKTLRSFGFTETDYVYEPGQFAVRGSIIDVYSYSSELPYRIDFFGDDIETIRTFEVESQLSSKKFEHIEVVPELATLSEEKVPFLHFLPADSFLAFKDFLYVRDAIENIYKEGFTAQALTAQREGKTEVEQHELEQAFRKEGQLITASHFMNEALNYRRIEFGVTHSISETAKKADGQHVTIQFNTTAQPLFHKNFDLLSKTLRDYLLQVTSYTSLRIVRSKQYASKIYLNRYLTQIWHPIRRICQSLKLLPIAKVKPKLGLCHLLPLTEQYTRGSLTIP